MGILTLIRFAAIALWILVLARVLLSWVDSSGRSRAATTIVGLTEPFLAPVRRLLPSTGMLDWSGFVVLLILGFIIRSL
jgi:YggT family protein